MGVSVRACTGIVRNELISGHPNVALICCLASEDIKQKERK